jgi:V8-like Glu-specific endopeptidase
MLRSFLSGLTRGRNEVRDVFQAPRRASRRNSRPVLESLEGRALLSLSPVSPSAGYPYTTGVELQITYPNGSHYVGSGVMVGPNDVMTAGHVVYDYAEGGWASSITVTPEYYYGSGRFGSATMTHEETYNTWLAYSKANPGLTAPGDMDIAIISLNHNIGNETGWLSYGYNNNNSTFASGNLMNTFGYPATTGYNGQQEEYSGGQIAGLSSDGSAIEFYQNQITIYGGSSGSPLFDYFPSNGSMIVYGIVVGGGGASNTEDFATRITSQIFNDFSTFISQNTTTTPGVAGEKVAETLSGTATKVPVSVPLAAATPEPSTLVPLVPSMTTSSEVPVTFGMAVPSPELSFDLLLLPPAQKVTPRSW